MKDTITAGYEPESATPYYMKMGTYTEYFSTIYKAIEFAIVNKDYFLNTNLVNNGINTKEYSELERVLKEC